MNAEDLTQEYGDEYPAAAVFEGVRMPLQRESRFLRSYESGDRGLWISRFMDGSASITAEELKRDWPSWTHELRMDFCNNCSWLGEQSDFADMLRFVMHHGDSANWSGVAISVAVHLPRDEAFGMLLRALQVTDVGGNCANLSQAIAHTKHPEAEAALRQHLQDVWAHPTLWDDDPFTNWVAFDARTCIQHLMELGASPADFEGQVRKLSEHVCAGDREGCRDWLSKHYSWLK